MGRLIIKQGDITLERVDTIVNAANTTLMGGGGVDGAIHRAAGPALDVACARLHGCPTGEARLTPGFALPARYIIHTPGPVWQGGQHNEAQLLANSYRNSLRLAVAHGCQTVAFPSISTGVYAYPVAKAAQVAIATIKTALAQWPQLREVRLVCFDEQTYHAYQRAAYGALGTT
ncbi:O-acetyl-ADP-ribose deacetylase [Limosilactobacillus ingluviei]|uniref:O-acetyl-ADP-ribose deacetylase n=1 Tax=Limosilactobacillus ingluviei TaxID=148604 RepID=UPI00265E6622|nr:O-acetyl-ADP-ribose deacetylase [Limosilactobacillus ingluviei]